MPEHIERLVANEDRKTIHIVAAGLTTEDLKRIVRIVNARKNPLAVLELKGNNIDDEGAEVLSALQKVNCFDINLLDSVNSEMQLSLARDTVRG